jgi:hypothetical protein
MKLYTRRSMLAWSAGAIAAAGPLAVQAASQITPEQQRILDCYPRYGTGEPVIYTNERLRCLEAELQRHIPISFENVPGEQAVDIAAAKRQDGRVHLILGDNEEVFRLFEISAFNTASPREILSAAAQIDGQIWLENEFRTAVAYRMEVTGPGDTSIAGIELHEFDPSKLHEVPISDVEIGEWPQAVDANDQILAVRDYGTGGFKPEVVIATLNESDWTKAAALLRYGNWNACPPPQVHVAVHRYWRERYGIELVSSQIDTLEFRVTNQPTDQETALALAREQYAYCNDIVDQGVGTLANLAATLMVSDYWYFWWD